MPIFLIAGVGYLVGKWLKINPRPVSHVIFYIFSPCLVFTLLTDNALSGADILRMMGFASLITLMIGGLSLGIGRIFRMERVLLVPLLLTTLFSNVGNYGLPLNLFAFGETGLAHATLYFVTNLIWLNTVGVVIASMGRTGFIEALKRLMKFPSTYSLVLAVILSQMHWQMPEPLDRTIRLLGNATIPLMLVLLGLQFQATGWRVNLRALVTSNMLRLVVSPLLAMGLAPLFALQGVARQAGILESAMPSAVLSIVLATEFNLNTDFVTSVVFVSTILSPFTILPLLMYLR